jgi:hypothetical protein
MRILAAIHPPEATRAILECLGLPARAPPVAPAAVLSDQAAELEFGMSERTGVSTALDAAASGGSFCRVWLLAEPSAACPG